MHLVHRGSFNADVERLEFQDMPASLPICREKVKVVARDMNAAEKLGDQMPTRVPETCSNRNSACPEAADFRPVPMGTAFITRVLTRENLPSTRKA